MIRNFFSIPNIIERLFIVLLFAAGVVYAGAFDGFVVESEASSCCGRGMDAAIFSSSNCCDEEEECDCLGGGHGCGSTSCNPDNDSCEVVIECDSNCGDCHLNEDGRPCAGDTHCKFTDSDDTICDGGCSVP